MAAVEKLYSEYKDVVEFRYIYISEAHALDDKKPKEVAAAKNIYEHKTYKDRCSVANMFEKDKGTKVPIIVDTIDNKIANLYNGRPTRAFVIGTDGILKVTGDGGSRAYRQNVVLVGEWLKKFKSTGKESQ